MKIVTQLLTGTAFATLIVLSPAIAESPNATNRTPPAATNNNTAPSATVPSTDQSRAELREMRASTLIGSSVRNAQNQSVGDINELLLATDGTIDRVVVGVGGFLGIGERNVALNFDSLNFTRDGDTIVIATSMTKEQLQALPEWKAN